MIRIGSNKAVVTMTRIFAAAAAHLSMSDLHPHPERVRMYSSRPEIFMGLEDPGGGLSSEPAPE
jgi:hypothetical protein